MPSTTNECESCGRCLEDPLISNCATREAPRLAGEYCSKADYGHQSSEWRSLLEHVLYGGANRKGVDCGCDSLKRLRGLLTRVRMPARRLEADDLRTLVWFKLTKTTGSLWDPFKRALGVFVTMVAARIASDQKERAHWETDLPSGAWATQKDPTNPEVAKRMDEKETHAAIRAKLSEPRFHVLRLRLVEGRTLKEIADEMHRSIGWARNQVLVQLRELRRELKDRFGPDPYAA